MATASAAVTSVEVLVLIDTVDERRLLVGLNMEVATFDEARFTTSSAVENSGLNPNVDPTRSAALSVETSLDPRPFLVRPLGILTGNWLMKSQVSNCFASIVN